MEFTASQIAAVISGTIEGNPDVKISRLAKIEEGEPGSLSFLANPKYTHYIYTTNASIVIVGNDFMAEQPVHATLIRVSDAYTAFASLLEMYNKIRSDKKGISSLSFVAPSVTLGKDVYIGEFAVIGENVVLGDGVKIFPHVHLGDNVRIGENTTLYAGVIVYSDNQIGNNCTLHGGVVIGADGFGFAPQQDKNYKKIAQIGNVIIEDDVEIGSNTTIDRATLGSTIIRRGVKLDNLIQVAHNVEIGENTVIAAQVGISDSTKIGRNCMIAGQVGFAGHLIIGDDVKIGAQSGVAGNIPDGATVLGAPAQDISLQKRSLIYFKNLPSLVSRIADLEKQVKKLTQ